MGQYATVFEALDAGVKVRLNEDARPRAHPSHGLGAAEQTLAPGWLELAVTEDTDVVDHAEEAGVPR